MHHYFFIHSKEKSIKNLAATLLSKLPQAQVTIMQRSDDRHHKEHTF